MWSGDLDSTDLSPESLQKMEPTLHRHSTSSLTPTPPPLDATTASLLLSDSLSSDVPGSSVQQPTVKLGRPTWTSATALFERSDHVAADADGYFTAHASMVSVVPNSDGGGTIGNPRNLGENVFITIGPTPLTSSGGDSSPSPSIQSGDVCRICHGEHTIDAPLIAPCDCSGSMKYVHQECIQTWLKSSHTLSCELCRFTYLTGTKVKPLCQWKSLDLTLLERWKIVCCVMIQLFAICYFVLSVEALVRAAKDFYVPQTAMWLWIKIIMSVFGISVSVACTLRQCKTFIRLFRRWETYNRTVFVKDRGDVSNGVVNNRVLFRQK